MVVDSQAEQQIATVVATVLAKLTQEPAPERLAFNLTEAAELTGVSEKQLRFAIARKELKGRKIGKSYRISRASLLAWIDAH